MVGMKDAIMYSTLEGAKKRAKQLNHILDASGFAFPLAKCQAAVARAGGYSDWHELTRLINQRANADRPYDYWGALVRNLPKPCHLPVRSHLRDDFASEPDDDANAKRWIRDTLPYLVSLEVVHRTSAALLRPGSGKDQRIRLQIISSMLLNGEGQLGLKAKLDPEGLTVIFEGPPDGILPKLAKHPRFADAVETLAAAGILTLDSKTTQINAPDGDELRAEITRRARAWNVQKEPEIQYTPMSAELSAALQLQNELDRKGAGPKVPYDTLDYRGVMLHSRYSVTSEFDTMKAVVDAMPDDVRLRLAAVWCDSKACAYHHVVVTLGMSHNDLAEQVRACFRAATSGFNGLMVEHGSHSEHFDPEWPEDEEYFAQQEEELHKHDRAGVEDREAHLPATRPLHRRRQSHGHL